MDTLGNLINELRRHYLEAVPVREVDVYLGRYRRFYNDHVEAKPSNFISSWHWSFARRVEFLKAFDRAGLVGEAWLRTDVADTKY